MSDVDLFNFTKGYVGSARDIRLCGRSIGGKRCTLCTRHAKYDEWSLDWHFAYMTEWYNDSFLPHVYWDREISWRQSSWRRRGHMPNHRDVVALKTPGINENGLKSLFTRGCRINKKCKCSAVVQRAAWYCSDCFTNIKSFCKETGMPIFHAQIMDRSELKEEILIRLLSGL